MLEGPTEDIIQTFEIQNSQVPPCFSYLKVIRQYCFNTSDSELEKQCATHNKSALNPFSVIQDK